MIPFIYGTRSVNQLLELLLNCSASKLSCLAHHNKAKRYFTAKRYRSMLEYPIDKFLFLSTIILSNLFNKYLRLKKHPNSVVCNKSSRLERIISSCPSLFYYDISPYYYLDQHGQLQTIFQTFIRSIFVPFSSIKYAREVLALKDGGTVALDWAVGSNRDKDYAPIILMHHGIFGDSNSDYIVFLVRNLLVEGYRPVVFVARGCGGLPLTSEVQYSAARYHDIDEVTRHIQLKYPLTKIIGIGFSLGAGMMLKYMGSYGDTARLNAAICVSPPWNFRVHSAVFGFWSFLLAIASKSFVLRNAMAVSKHTKKTLPMTAIMLSTSIQEIDSIFAELYGFDNAEKYYDATSPNTDADKIAFPTLVLSAADDPLCSIEGAPAYDTHIHPFLYGTKRDFAAAAGRPCSSEVIPVELQTRSVTADGLVSCAEYGPGLVQVTSRAGGHLAFPEGHFPVWTSWADRAIIEWIRAVLKDDISSS